MATEPTSDSLLQPAIFADHAVGSPTPDAKHKLPPPEPASHTQERRFILIVFWAIILLLGFPIWIWTTTVHRSALPLEAMNKWADGHACRFEFPLHVAIESDSLRRQDIQQLAKVIQQTIDDHHVPSLHHIRVSPSGQLDIDSAINVKLQAGPDIKTPSSTLLPYEPVLEVQHANFTNSPHPSAYTPLAGFIASELYRLFGEEQAALAHLFAEAGRPSANQKLSPESTQSLSQRSKRTFRYAPSYHLTFSLFSGVATPASWEIQAAVQEYLAPLLASFASISSFTIDTQVQLYASLPPSMAGPHYDNATQVWYLDAPDLSGFINAAEWPLSPGIGAAPTINFIVYAPSESQQPLALRGSTGTSWIIPQWGGVQILNPAQSGAHAETLTKEDLRPIIRGFADQLITLLGLPSQPASLPVQLDSLTRERTASLILSASSTLGALSRLTLKLTSIAIPDKVAVSVEKTLSHLDLACQSLHSAQYRSALGHARIAEAEAEEAFFEPSMVGQVYFPDEHKVAVYVPLLGPMAVPLIMALVKELKKLKRA